MSGMPQKQTIFYGWWIVAAAFLNLFLAVGVIFYGFPVFYSAFVKSLGFTRAQVTQGFLFGFLFAKVLLPRIAKLSPTASIAP